MTKAASGASSAKPSRPPTSPFREGDDPIYLQAGYVWAPLRGEWLLAKPEELVRQRFVHRLHVDYGYALEQMAQERRTMHGRNSPKADVVIARDAQALSDNRDYVLVVETKAENVTIVPADYWQGESYARAVGCEFLVAHNEKETRAFRLVPGAPGERVDIEAAPSQSDVNDARRLEKVRRATKAFSRDEFRRLLQECHTILRDNHKLDPGAAFDEISKVLFIKMFFERGADADRFTKDYLDRYQRIRRSRVEGVMRDLFEDTKKGLAGDQLFDSGDQLNISYATFRRLVEKLERFNLSATSEDIKGIAFEQFLGQTFRGELGQFFTPRPIVDFVVELLDPKEGELICDPACGTGGFLIRAFDHVRAQIETDIQIRKTAEAERLEAEAEAQGWSEEDLGDALAAAAQELNRGLDIEYSTSRLGRLSRECIFGTDAEPRAARTSKMNMIMHGDGHGGIYFHDGLLDTEGFLENRFDVVLTNPPFGATVTVDQLAGDTPQTRFAGRTPDRELESRFGDAWRTSREKYLSAERNRRPVLELFDIGRDPIAGPRGAARVRNSRPTEALFLERVIRLLRPGGRCAIVLPDGVLNNPSMQWLRDYVDGRAALDAVVSLPQEVFASAKATVKTSVLVLHRLSAEEQQRWAAATAAAGEQLDTERFDREREVIAAQARSDLDDLGLDGAEALSLFEAIALASASASSKGEVAQLRQRFNGLVPAERRKELRSVVKARDRSLAELETVRAQAILERTRQLCDYQVLMAEVEQAGITATGTTGETVPNELPGVLQAYKEWRQSRLLEIDSV